MSQLSGQWRVLPAVEPPLEFVQAVLNHLEAKVASYAASLLWQRGLRSPEALAGFLDPAQYQPTSPWELGSEMQLAVERLQQAQLQDEKVAIWGDFDADGLTATAVLWEGLGRLFEPWQRLYYYIPNRFTESHGLSIQGIDDLHTKGCQLIVTCDTGCNNLNEISYARRLGIDVIVTDHHTLPRIRPPATALINPRVLPPSHPLATLSGVAVAYKLLEALYDTLGLPQDFLASLLDLVAIGLIADLVELRGDCRYLAQLGIQRLQQHTRGGAAQSNRPGIAYLLEWCRRNGNRPTDISFGLGPRINAISRIQGDARLGVELLTSSDPQQSRHLAELAELANTRRKALQRQVWQQAVAQLTHVDWSTTNVIVLVDPQWPVGILGLVAGQIAQEYGRPTILLSTEAAGVEEQSNPNLARGSARSVGLIDLYQLIQGQEHLLHRFGGHPLAMGLSLPSENIPLLKDALNRQLRQVYATPLTPTLQIDLVLSVADLLVDDGKALFRQLKLLEPCGMGNPVPKLQICNCWFQGVWQQHTLADLRNQTVRYAKTEFEIWDDSATQGFPGVWWGHYRDEIPSGRCDAVVELDFNPGSKQRQSRYEVRLIAIRPAHATISPASIPVASILDWRQNDSSTDAEVTGLSQTSSEYSALILQQCPTSWSQLQAWHWQAQTAQKTLALAYKTPCCPSPLELWRRLVGIAKYLSRTGLAVSQEQLCQKLEISLPLLEIGLQILPTLGFEILTGPTIQISGELSQPQERSENLQIFWAAVQEEQFRQQFLCQAPVEVLQALAQEF